MQETLALALLVPVVLKAADGTEQTYSMLSLVEPDVNALIEAQKCTTNAESSAVLIARSAGVPRTVVNLMKIRDFKAADAFLSTFLGSTQPAAPETGSTSAPT